MRKPVIRFFNPEFDYEAVLDMLRDARMDPPGSAKEFSGLALVALDELAIGEDRVIGFVWALAANGTPVAYVDYFVVHREVRQTMVGVWLLLALLAMLKKEGVLRVIGTLSLEAPSRILRALVSRGGRDLGPHRVVVIPLGGDDGKKHNPEHE